jgi:hypothetical protein
MNKPARLRSFLLLTFGLMLTASVALYSLSPVQAAPTSSRASLAAATTSSWSDSLAEVGMPASPTMWQPSNFDVQTHIREQNTSGGFIDQHMADHGADCSAPPAQHSINTWQQAVFACHMHVMTAIADEGYGEVVLTPDHMADWSAGPVTIGFSVSTLRTTSRDWITVTVSPFGEQLALPFDFGDVDLAGMPRHYVELKSGLEEWNGVQTNWQMAREDPGNDFGDLQNGEWPYFEEATGITPSASTRTPFELTISKSGYSFRVAPSSPVAGGKVLLSGSWSKALTFTQGVVQFAHHSYNPNKCDVVAIRCVADTWHWSDFSISSAVPYTLLRPIDHQVVSEPGGVVTFASPAPSGSFLKFAAIGSVQVSYDGGKTYAAAVKAPLDGYGSTDEHFNSFLSPVPAGASSVLLKLTGGWYGPGMARDSSLISQTLAGAPPPTPTPTPVPPTPTATPTAPPSPTPGPTPTPIPLQHVPCSVAVGDTIRDGYCDGTFYPNP